MALVDAVMPLPSLNDDVKALKDAERLCLNMGLTIVNDAGLDRSTIEFIDSLQQAGELASRVYAMLSNNSENLDYYLNKGLIKTDRLNVRSVKVYGDRALGSRGAALKKPYSDKPDHVGSMIAPVSEIGDLALRIAATEYQMNTRAIGDSANAFVLRACEKALSGKADRRWKVEHAQVLDVMDFDFFKNGIIPPVQPTHATSDMYWAVDRLGSERVKGAYVFKSLLNNAGMVALGTDFPEEQVIPFPTFYAAVVRKDLEGYPEGGYQMQNALSREEALRGMTSWAAYSNFEENEKGSIAVGKLADFTIYDKNRITVPAKEIPSIRAELTYIDGIPG